MAHYAKVKNGIVENVLVAEKNFIDSLAPETGVEWVKTSYNMRAGVYFDPNTGAPAEDQSIIKGDEARERKNYAAVGFSYDKTLNAFIPEKPFDSWVLNEETCVWEAPKEYPNDGKSYMWDESVLDWIIEE